MARQRIKPASTNVVEIADVYDEIGAAYVTAVTSVTGRLLTSAKAPLGTPVSLSWVYVTGTNGTWRAIIANTVALTDATAYYAEAVFTLTNGAVRTFYVALVTQADDN